MKTLVFLIVAIASCDLYAQSVLDALRQPTANAELELLNQANQASQNSANAAAKRATLLQRRADELRSQVDRLESEVEKLRAEHAALKMAVIDCREHFVAIVELLEKKDFTAIVAPLEKLKAAYKKSLLPKLITKEPVAEGDSKIESIGEVKVEAPVVVNPALQVTAPKPTAPQPTVTEQPLGPQPDKVPEK